MQIASWLNDEWPVPELVVMHGKLAQAVSDAYRVIRSRGEDDMGGVLLSIGNELMTFQSFRPTFTDPFEVRGTCSWHIFVCSLFYISASSTPHRTSFQF